MLRDFAALHALLPGLATSDSFKMSRPAGAADRLKIELQNRASYKYNASANKSLLYLGRFVIEQTTLRKMYFAGYSLSDVDPCAITRTAGTACVAELPTFLLKRQLLLFISRLSTVNSKSFRYIWVYNLLSFRLITIRPIMSASYVININCLKFVRVSCIHDPTRN
jgi:hypothetical protein